MKDYLNYTGKICVVTGAASGIGKATIDILNELNAEVYALDRNPIDQENVKYISVDLNDKNSIDDAFKLIPDHIDCFFGVAGLSGAITNYYTTFTVNFIANKYITEEYLKPRMSQGGAIAYVTSSGGRHWEKYSHEFAPFIKAKTWEEMITALHNQANEDTIGMMSYPLSKRAMNFYMAEKAAELGDIGIRVNALLPGSTDTGMIDEFEVEAGGNDALIAETGVAHRLATPEEMALPLIFLNSDMAGFISGHPLIVDYANEALINIKLKKDRLNTRVGSKLLNLNFFQNILKKQLEPLDQKTTSTSSSETSKDSTKEEQTKEQPKEDTSSEEKQAQEEAPAKEEPIAQAEESKEEPSQAETTKEEDTTKDSSNSETESEEDVEIL